jgi:hypothetical protein
MASQWRIAVHDDDEFSQLEQGGPVWTHVLSEHFFKLKVLSWYFDWVMHSPEAD